MNNFTYENILEALRNGTSAEDIAASLSDTLSKAQAQIVKDEEAKAAAAAKNARKDELTKGVMDALNAYGAHVFDLDEEDFLSFEETKEMLDDAFAFAATASATEDYLYDKLKKLFPNAKIVVREDSHDETCSCSHDNEESKCDCKKTSFESVENVFENLVNKLLS